ncbi:MAG: HNH endonuclease [Candidatus Micrarchaeota archaeon]
MADYYYDKKGYRRFSDSGTPVHQWVAEKKLGRSLRGGEVVHHKNRDKQDNSHSNLHVFPSQRKHWKTHKNDGW